MHLVDICVMLKNDVKLCLFLHQISKYSRKAKPWECPSQWSYLFQTAFIAGHCRLSEVLICWERGRELLGQISNWQSKVWLSGRPNG